MNEVTYITKIVPFIDLLLLIVFSYIVYQVYINVIKKEIDSGPLKNNNDKNEEHDQFLNSDKQDDYINKELQRLDNQYESIRKDLRKLEKKKSNPCKCGRKFSSELSLEVHRKNCKVINQPRKDNNSHYKSQVNYKCKCGKNYSSLLLLKKHESVCSNRCLCSKIFSTPLMLKVHQKECDTYSKRRLSNKILSDSQEPKIDLISTTIPKPKYEHYESKKVVENHECYCGKKFDTARGLNIHKNSCKLKCKCGKFFKSDRGLKIHLRSCKKNGLAKKDISISKDKIPVAKTNPLSKTRSLYNDNKSKRLSEPLKQEDNYIQRKKAKTEILPPALKEINKKGNELIFVNYSSPINNQLNKYPIVSIPKRNNVIKSFRFGSSKLRGFKEQSFQETIAHYFSTNFKIYGDIRLNTGKNTRPFEPDIAIISKSNINIRINIEIDEPYASITRQAIHCKGEDRNRDIYFNDRGWIVIRFSEYQVHTQEMECIKFISSVISSINAQFNAARLEIYSNPKEEESWDLVQAQKWEKQNYREKYLNHSFSEIIEKPETLRRDFNQHEIEEEKLVISTSFGKASKGNNIGYNRINFNPRDKRVKFYSEPHVYTIDGVPSPSATTVINKFFDSFDSYGKAANLSRNNPLYGTPVSDIVKIWNNRGKEAAEQGTFLHEQIENFYLGKPYSKPQEFYQFQQFDKDHKNLTVYRSEWRVFDDNFNVAGTIDLIAENNGVLDIYDWKRSKKVINPYDGQPIEHDRWGNTGIGELEHIDDTSYNRYKLQQSLYKYILEQNYGIKVNAIYIIVIHPINEKYYKVKVPYLKDEIEYILRTV